MPHRLDRLAISYQLSFEAPFHCGSGLPRGLLDRAVQRDARGLLFVPGSTLKGVLRERCEQLARLFGVTPVSPHDERAALEEFDSQQWMSRLFGSRLYPGSLCFDDALMVAEDQSIFRGGGKQEADREGPDAQPTHLPQVTERTQVSLSRRTRTARPGFLFSSEYGLPGLRFAGEISGYLNDIPVDSEDARSPTYALLLLVAGLLSIERLGGNRSAGAGRCRLEINSLDVGGVPMKVKDCLEQIEYLALLEYALAEEEAPA